GRRRPAQRRDRRSDTRCPARLTWRPCSMPRYAPSALGHIPEHLGVERAPAGTAWVVLARLGLAAGSRLLVLGGSGGVGLFLLQLAAAAGVVTIGVGRRAMHDQMIGLGAAACIDYVREDAARRTLT